MKRLGIVLLSYVFILGGCTTRQEGGGLPDKGIGKYDTGVTGDQTVPDPDGIMPPDSLPLPPDGPIAPPDGPLVPPDGPIAPPDAPPPPPDGPIAPPDAPPPPPDGPIAPPDGPVVTPDGPIVKQDGPVITPDGPVITPDKAIPPDQGPPLNNKCSTAKDLNWGGAKKITATGTTSGMGNEYGTGINCGNYQTIMSGQQAYYKASFTAGKSYRVSLSPKFSYAYVYLFQKCGVNNINAGCGSGGKTGAVSGYIGNNQTGTVMFKPATSGTYYIAVDGRYTQYSGSFTLVVEEFVKPANDSCAKATKLTLVNGKASVSASTTGANNEFGKQINCKINNRDYDGPQLYYRVTLKAGTTYDVYLDPDFTYANMYLFRASACNSASAINGDCGSKGSTGTVDDFVSTAGETLKFTPKVAGDYIIAVDSRTPSYHGSFKLSIEEFKKPTNGTCKTAQTITMSGGKASVTGNTSGISNEFGNQIRCGLSSWYALDGPQAYYKMFLAGTKQYKFTLSPGFYARFYIWRNTCDPGKINSDCGSNGKTGALSSTVYTNYSGSVTFKPPAGGTYHIAVDSTSNSYAGKFTMTVEEYTPPTNGTCAKAKPLNMTGNKLTVTGDTTGMSNEFGTQISCGTSSSSYIFDGNQQYYSINLTAGQSYKFTLAPKFYAGLYIFGNTCSPQTIAAHCGSGGKQGDVVHYVYNNQTKSVTFQPTKTGTYRFAVDSYSNSSYYRGAYTVTIEKWTPGAHSTCKNAKKVTLSSGTTTITGDTTGMKNEWGTAINCGNLNTIYKAEQAYYKFSLTAGKSYTFTLSPKFSYAQFYIFTLLGGVCGITPINNTCGSNGNYGAVSALSYNQNPVSVTFTPKLTRDYYVAVDSRYTGRFGAFTLTVK